MAAKPTDTALAPRYFYTPSEMGGGESCHWRRYSLRCSKIARSISSSKTRSNKRAERLHMSGKLRPPPTWAALRSRERSATPRGATRGLDRGDRIDGQPLTRILIAGAVPRCLLRRLVVAFCQSTRPFGLRSPASLPKSPSYWSWSNRTKRRPRSSRPPR